MSQHVFWGVAIFVLGCATALTGIQEFSLWVKHYSQKIPESKAYQLLVACYATLQPALSVCQSVGPSVRLSVGPSVRPSVRIACAKIAFLGLFWPR